MELHGHPIITNISSARFTTNCCGVVSQLSCRSHTHAHTRNNDDDDDNMPARLPYSYYSQSQDACPAEPMSSNQQQSPPVHSPLVLEASSDVDFVSQMVSFTSARAQRVKTGQCIIHNNEPYTYVRAARSHLGVAHASKASA